MYTKVIFGRELKEQVSQMRDIVEIGIWAHSVYLEHCEQLESGLRQVMLDLNTMELGKEFAISYEILNRISDDLIASKTVDLNSKEYRQVDIP